MTRPVIAIPTVEMPAVNDEPPIWAMRSSYARPLIAAGATVVFLPQILELDEIESVLPTVSGLLLAGGADIAPGRYGRQPEPGLEATDPARDQSELTILTWAMAQKLPTLGICRGLQMINVALGGSLYQHLAERQDGGIAHRTQPPSYASLRDHGHPLSVTAGSYFERLVGGREAWVNSMHHEGIDRLASSLLATATSADGLIEVIESADQQHWLVGIQGHPEAMTESSPWVSALFREFVQAAADFRLTNV